MNTKSMTAGMSRSYDEKERVTAEAERLCELLGPGWTHEVWCNWRESRRSQGWHFRAVFDNLIYVCPSTNYDGTYFCMLGKDGSMSAHLAPEHVQGHDPRVVVERTLAGYREKWEKFRAEQDAIMSAGDECVEGWKAEAKPDYVQIGDEAFGGDLAIFCDLSECDTPLDAVNQVDALIDSLRRVSAKFSEMAACADMSNAQSPHARKGL